MKLTKGMKSAFVRAVMADVPSVDYIEQLRSIMLKEAVSHLPPAVKKVWDNPDTRDYVNTCSYYFGTCSTSVRLPSNEPNSWGHTYPHPIAQEVAEQIRELIALDHAQDDAHQELKSKLRAAVEACTTRKQLAELLPEFEKYLPADDTKAIKTNLPAVANVVAEFSKAGWPKGKELADLPAEV